MAAGSTAPGAWRCASASARKFNFELQAAATEDNIVLSLTTAHSFDLAEVPHYLHPATRARRAGPGAARRADVHDALALGGRGGAGAAALPRRPKVPPPLARMDAEDLIAAIFPDQLACAENLAGPREIPDHPLVRQTIADCLTRRWTSPGWSVC